MLTNNSIGERRLLSAYSCLVLFSLIFLVNYDVISSNVVSNLNQFVDNTEISSHQKHVFIIARAHRKQPRNQIKAFVHSLLAQTHKHFTLWVVNGNNPSERIFSKQVSDFEDRRVSSLSFNFSRPKNFFHSFGYHTTDLALRKVIETTKSGDRNQFLLVTNSDNLYHSLFLETSLKMVDEETCFIASNWISRFALSKNDTPNQAETVAFGNGGIDLGCVISSLFHVRQVYNEGPYFKKNEMAADWLFFEKLMKTFGTHCVKKTDQVLFIHQ